MPWLGVKKLALVPVYRPNAMPPDVIPDNWSNVILERMLFFLNQQTRQDVSLRAYIHTVSSGRADLSAVVQPMQTIDQQDVPPGAFEASLGPSLRAQGFDCAALVMLGGVGAGTSAGFWVRFVMLEGTGVWAMEFMHSLTGFGDLYPFGGNMAGFDEMACSCATHPSAFTKRAIQWIDGSTIAHHRGVVGTYELYSISRKQPPPRGSVAAVQIGEQVPYIMVESRQKGADQFDANIPSEGVIVYVVQTRDPLGNPQNATAPVMLLTPTALKIGQRYASRSPVITVDVIGGDHNGFKVKITTPLVPSLETEG
jgi:hypothetical protein